MSETWLSPDEVGELTGLKPNSWRAQCRKLEKMGVAYRPNGAGRPLVERAAVLKYPNGLAELKRRMEPRRKTEPNWDAIGAPRRKP